jgi:hypothetical protein
MIGDDGLIADPATRSSIVGALTALVVSTGPEHQARFTDR